MASLPLAILEHAVNDLAGALQIRDRALDIHLLFFQMLNAVSELVEGHPKLRNLAVAQVIEVKHFLDFGQGEANPLALKDQLETSRGPGS